jgi:hypothetical protein
MTFSYLPSPKLTRYVVTAVSSHSVMGVLGEDGLGDTAVMPLTGDSDAQRDGGLRGACCWPWWCLSLLLPLREPLRLLPVPLLL